MTGLAKVEIEVIEMSAKPSVTLPGTVEKVIPSLSPQDVGTVEISVDTPHDLYRQVRIENTLTNESGGKVSPKLGSPAEVTSHRGGWVHDRSISTTFLAKNADYSSGLKESQLGSERIVRRF